MASLTNYLGIRYPFTTKDPQSFYVDLDSDIYQQIKNDLIHLIFTQKGTRIRKPDFGTNLVWYLFYPNDDVTNTDIKLELQEAINKYIPNITINKIKAEPSKTEMGLSDVRIEYSIDEGNSIVLDALETTI